jgi:mannose-6-phosphate isomerase
MELYPCCAGFDKPSNLPGPEEDLAPNQPARAACPSGRVKLPEDCRHPADPALSPHKMAKFSFFRKATATPEVAAEDSVFAALAPFRVAPRFVPRIWGFRDLSPWYRRAAPGDAHLPENDPDDSGGEPIGEVWLTGDDCLIASGAHAGKTLRELFQVASEALLGRGAPATDSPLLVKMIFAREKLSVQVHPDDWMAQKYGQPRGKTECWYAMSAEPGAQVAVGLKPGVTLDELREGIEDGTLEKSLQVLNVETGDMIFVDAGTVHAIWPGSILLETQQNSDITYRMFDYGRPRELHTVKSLEAVRLVTRAGKVAPHALADRTVLVDEEYFCVERIPVNVSRSSTTLPGRGEGTSGLSYLFAAAGSGRLASPSFAEVELPMCGIVAVPASSPIFAVQDMGGLDLIRISPRWPGKLA